MVDQRRRPRRPFSSSDVILQPRPKLIIERSVSRTRLPARRLNQGLIGTECHILHRYKVHEGRVHDKHNTQVRLAGSANAEWVSEDSEVTTQVCLRFDRIAHTTEERIAYRRPESVCCQ